MYALVLIFSTLTPEGQTDGYRTVERNLSHSACTEKAQNNNIAAGKGMVATLNCVPQS